MAADSIDGRTTNAKLASLGLGQLESHLWEAANILRGPVDAADFKERNLTTAAIARMNLFLHGAADFQIVRGDTLRNPVFFLGDALANFDCVIANPPFSLEKWGEEVWTSDPYGRNFAGMPPGRSGDYAWVQHMIKSMAPKTGRMAVLLLIVDASREYRTGRAQNELLPEHVERIHGWGRDFKDVEGVARVVSLEEIAANDHNLIIPRYVEPKVETEALSVDEAMKRLKESAEGAFAAEDHLVALLRKEALLR